ncbi:MAG: S-layer homology domain-containing protein [Patescibacteria group bacterium]
MIKKKITAKSSAKPKKVLGDSGVPKMVISGIRRIQPHDRPFIGFLALFIGFSVYTISSFLSSNNSYIKQMFTDVTGVPAEVIETNSPFSDLMSDHSNFEAIIALYYEGIIGGYADGTYKPENSVNRAEFAKMLVEAADLDYTKLPPSDIANCFTDVSDLPDHWFAPSVCASKYEGWVKGYDGGKYSPTKGINRAEALKIILTAFEFDVLENSLVSSAPYDDVPLDAWYLGVAQSAKENGIIRKLGVFDASGVVSRAHVAQMIYNAMKSKGML